MSVRIIEGDCLATLRTLSDGAAQCCVTSPPYYGLRDYQVAGQIGLEETPDAYVARLVDVFREVRRALTDDGTLWLNLGDSYAGSWGARGRGDGTNAPRPDFEAKHGTDPKARNGFPTLGVKPKDLLMIPAQVALALRADGWWLRSAITWCKPAPMPESVRDRPTSATEQVFLLAKRPSYFYDASAIAEPFADDRMGSSGAKSLPYSDGSGRHDTLSQEGKPGLGASPSTGCRNARNWWVIAPSGYSGAHFATMPPALAERCIKAGSRPGDTILDPFGGAGTTGLVADRLGRSAILCELNPEYAALARERITGDCPMFAETAA